MLAKTDGIISGDTKISSTSGKLAATGNLKIDKAVINGDLEHKKWKSFEVASAHLTHDHRTKVEKVTGGRWRCFDRLHCLVHFLAESGGQAVGKALVSRPGTSERLPESQGETGPSFEGRAVLLLCQTFHSAGHQIFEAPDAFRGGLA